MTKEQRAINWERIAKEAIRSRAPEASALSAADVYDAVSWAVSDPDTDQAAVLLGALIDVYRQGVALGVERAAQREKAARDAAFSAAARAFAAAIKAARSAQS